MKHKVAIALGGNQGNMQETFRRAVAMLSEALQNIRMASIRVTKPVDCVSGTGDFHNSALVADYDGNPEELLDLCQNIEQTLGRPAEHSSHEGRTIDLDILLFDDMTIDNDRLSVPHPRMCQRRFVLEPLNELIPEQIVPGTGKPISELFASVLREECYQAQSDLIGKVEEKARNLLAACPACHDWDHTLRVRRNAMLLARCEGADLVVVDIAALLHDIGRPQELADHGKTDHAEVGAAMIPALLDELGVKDEMLIRHVAACVLTHRYRTRAPERYPESLEAKCVFDADKLDSMGAIGVARSLHFAGRIGARVHNTAEEALGSDNYSREDSAYREYLVKLRFLKDRMLTENGKRLALERHAFMTAFFDELNRETAGQEHL